jgi:hypothetical protein
MEKLDMRRLFLAGGQAGLTNQLEPGCLAWAWAVPRKKKKEKKKNRGSDSVEHILGSD